MSGHPPSLATFVRPQKKHFFAHINDNLCEQRLSEIYHPNIDYAYYFKSVTRKVTAYSFKSAVTLRQK